MLPDRSLLIEQKLLENAKIEILKESLWIIFKDYAYDFDDFFFKFQTKVKAMDDYGPIENLAQEPVTVFVCATTGQGDQPDNMVKFWRYLLKRSLAKDILKGLSYGVLGLGDSGYAQFNYAAKRLNRRLAQLGEFLYSS